MRIGVFGGSFDPIHNGHIALSQAFVEVLSLEKVLVIPAFVSPFKQQDGAARPEQRLAMCRLAFADYPHTEVLDVELRREGSSYTVDTLRILSEIYPDSELFLITGADAFLTLQNWREPQEIFRLATICTVPRDGNPVEKLQQHADYLHTLGARTEIVDVQVIKVSSTEIRDRVKAGISLTGLVPDEVARYIAEQALYL